MKVEINRWTGETFESPNCICWVCGKPATVVELPDRNGAVLARVCKTCLNLAMQAISGAILDYHRKPWADVKDCPCDSS